jgi:hypothetical protein
VERADCNVEGVISLSENIPVQPSIILWAWERPEDLRFITPREVGVAFLAQSIYIRGKDIYVRPRFQPLYVPQGTHLTAVARIETTRRGILQDSPDLHSKLISAILRMAEIKGISAVQIDFDAKFSERPFYRQLIYDLRMLLPKSIGLSITALVSWCIHDNWLSGLPVDEVIPMLFRLGQEKHWVSHYLERGGDFNPVFRQSVGISTDELLTKFPKGRRIYIFHPKPWSQDVFKKIMREVKE